MNKYSKIYILLLAIVVTLSGSNLFAQNKLVPPSDFLITNYQDGIADKGNFVVQAIWTDLNLNTVDGYKIYKAVQVNGIDTPELLETVANNNEGVYYKDYRGFSKGEEVTLFIKSFKGKGADYQESEESRRVTTICGEYSDTTTYSNFYFEIEYPKRPLFVGETQKFKVKTYNDENCKINFVLQSSPFIDTLTFKYSFDEINRELSVTALKPGGVYIDVTGTLDCNKYGAFTTIFSTNIIEVPNNTDLFFAKPLPDVIEVASGHSTVFDYRAFAKNASCNIKYQVVETDMNIHKSNEELNNSYVLDKGGYFDDLQGALYFTTDLALVTDEKNDGQKSGYVVVKAFLDGCDTNLAITIRTKYVLVKDNNNGFENLVKVEVVQEDGKPAQGQVTAFVTDISYADLKGGFPLYTSLLDQNGIAYFQVPSDVDFTIYYQNAYTGEWFEDATSIENAKFMRFSRSDSASIKMIVDVYKEPIRNEVSGRTTDENGNPISSYVVFFPEELLFGGIPTDPYNQQPIYTATDYNGYYKAELFEDKNYIAAAYRTDDIDGKDVWYYNQVRIPMEAESINGSKKNENIDFKFNTSDLNQSNLKGKVVNKDGESIQSTLSAIKVDGSIIDLLNSYSLTTMTNENGEFEFTNTKDGKYIIFSMPSDKHYLPGYMVENDLTTQEWRKASIAIANGINPGKYLIVHEKLEKTNGAGEIKGTVSGKRSIFSKKDNQIESMKAMSGVAIVAKDSRGKAYTHGMTNSKGEYNLKGLVPGTYTIETNAIGYNTNLTQVVIDYNYKASIVNNVVLDNVASVAESEVTLNNLDLFPLPAANNLTVRFESKTSGNGRINIFDLNGKLVEFKSINLTAGQNQIDYNISSFSNGSYLIEIESPNSKVNSSFSISK